MQTTFLKLAAIDKVFEDPEHEKEFQEWLAQRQREPKEEGDARPA